MTKYPGWTLEDFWCRGMFEDTCRTLSIPRYIIAEIFRVYDQTPIIEDPYATIPKGEHVHA